MKKSLQLFVVLTIGVLVLSSGYQHVDAYNKYTNGCATCHGGFLDGDPSLHSMHQGVVNSCTDCHVSIGDDPSINSSGNYANYSCNGCHNVGGLRDFHVAKGHSCSPCHDGAASITEDVLPYFYEQNRSAINDPCKSTGAGAEDADGDAEGLDNDGDGVYDEADADCAGTAVESSSWSAIKQLYDSE